MNKSLKKFITTKNKKAGMPSIHTAQIKRGTGNPKVSGGGYKKVARSSAKKNTV